MSDSTAHDPAAHAPAPETPAPIRGRVFKYGDAVDTDVIFPGKYTYTLKSPAELARHALEDLDPGFAAAVRPGDVIVAGRNWGCGSSREQAVTCLLHAGVGAIVAASFARIFYRNAINNGLPAVVCPEAVAAVAAGDEITVDLERCEIRSGGRGFPFPPMSPTVRSILGAGGLIPWTMARLAPQVEQRS
jgi:3-isopropylmalate/(R)-2-methylmalate dehydratase small subunit